MPPIKHVLRSGRGQQAHLRVHNDFHCFALVCRLVQINGAQAIGVAHDGYLRRPLNAADECIAPAWDNEVDVAVLSEQRVDLFPRLDRLDIGLW